MNIDEVDFFDRDANSPAFMHIRKTGSDEISIGFGFMANGDIDLRVSVENARRLGERLVAAANEVASER